MVVVVVEEGGVEEHGDGAEARTGETFWGDRDTSSVVVRRLEDGCQERCRAAACVRVCVCVRKAKRGGGKKREKRDCWMC